jgi:hypothetical protein
MSLRTSKIKPPAGFSVCKKSTSSFPSTVKAENTMPTPFPDDHAEKCNHCHKDLKQVRAIAAVETVGWDQTGLRREQLNDQGIGPILEEVESGQCPEWKDIADSSPIYKSYWAQWNSLAARNDILKRHWKSLDRRSKIAQIILPRGRVKDVLIELHGGSSGHLGVNKTLDKVRLRCY